MLLWLTELKISDMDEWIDSDDDSDDSDSSDEKKDREEKDEKDKKKKTKKGLYVAFLYYIEGMAIKLFLTFIVCAVLLLVHCSVGWTVWGLVCG